MSKATALPFLAAHDSINVSKWHRLDAAGIPTHLPSTFTDWDYQTTLDLMTEVEVDLPAFLEETGFPTGVSFEVLTVVTCADTFHRSIQSRNVLAHGATEIRFEMRGDFLARAFELEILVVLKDHTEAGSGFSAREAGSVLFRDSSRHTLEPGGDLFPIEPVSFKSRFPGVNAERVPWHLHLAAFDLDLPMRDQVVLQVNTDTPDFLDVIASGLGPEVKMIRAQIAELVLARAVFDDAKREDLGREFEAGSLGDFVSGLMEFCFPGEDAEEIKRTHEVAPHQYQLKVRSALL